eukprot:181637-Amphidinium_carterae.1
MVTACIDGAAATYLAGDARGIGAGRRRGVHPGAGRNWEHKDSESKDPAARGAASGSPATEEIYFTYFV